MLEYEHTMEAKIKSLILSSHTRRWLFWLSIVVFLAAVFLALYWQVLPQPAVYFLNDISVPGKGQEVLVFSPHCDDETISGAGLIQRAIKNGAKVDIVLVTDCNKQHAEEKRFEETKGALRVLGVSDQRLVYLNYPDGNLHKEDEAAVAQHFQDVIDQLKPDLLIAPTDRDTHLDHRVTGRLIQQIARADQIALYQYLVHYPYFPSPKKFMPNDYLLPPLKLITFDKKWMKLDLLESEEDIKNEAVLQYKSQLKNRMIRGILLGSIRKNELFAVPL